MNAPDDTSALTHDDGALVIHHDDPLVIHPDDPLVIAGRTNMGQNANEPSLLDHLPPSQFTLLPNTAGCYTADDAVRTLKLARELLDGHRLVKLEVLGDTRTLFPNVRETIRAAE